jgi:hypothetical protein
MSQDVEKLAKEVYGPDVVVETVEAAPGAVQVAVLHPVVGLLVLATGRDADHANAAVIGALQSLKGA